MDIPSTFITLRLRSPQAFRMRHMRLMLIVTLAVADVLTVNHISSPIPFGYILRQIALRLHLLPVSPVRLWLVINTVILVSCLTIFWRFWVSVLQILQRMHVAAQPAAEVTGRMLAVRSGGVLKEMAQLSQLVEEQSRYRNELKHELEMTRAVLARYQTEHQLLLHSTGREIGAQYEAVIHYAQYLDAHIESKRQDPQLRYDFDDVCESSFNLRLITGALELLHSKAERRREATSLGPLMQRTMIALSASLDRRAMKLTTAEVDPSVVALSDAGLLSHVLWMMLLGMIRYAADESTLRMRCLYDHGQKRALLSIVVSELAPGALSPAERQAHLTRQMQQETPHMFAETLMRHGNVQLAELLLQRLDATITVLPLTAYACELCLSLPVGSSL